MRLAASVAIVVAAVVLAILGLAGCGGGEEFTSSNASRVDSGWLSHGLKLVRVEVDGTEMLCLERRGNSGDYVSGQYSGLTCDWYGWRKKREADR